MTVEFHPFRLGARSVHQRSERIDARIIHHRVRFSIDFSLEQHLVLVADDKVNGVVSHIVVAIVALASIIDLGRVNQQPYCSAGRHNSCQGKYGRNFQ